jgi:hypothetical protein
LWFYLKVDSFFLFLLHKLGRRPAFFGFRVGGYCLYAATRWVQYLESHYNTDQCQRCGTGAYLEADLAITGIRILTGRGLDTWHPPVFPLRGHAESPSKSIVPR